MKNRKASRCRLLRLLSVLGLLSAAFLLCLLGSCRNAASDSDTETRSDAATGTATEPTTAATGSATDQNNTETDTAPEQTTAAGGTVEPEIRLDTVTDVTLPDSSTEFSWTLAKQLLGLCTGNTREGSTQRFEKAGFKAILHKNYDKPDEDPSHTSAYSVGQKTVTWGGRERTVLLVSIRGTNAGEWYSNADIVPSRDPNTAFAENFYLAAQDIYEGLKSVLATVQDPVILVSGHSRGAACANLLGVLLNADRGTKDVFVYTFASPNTVRKTPDVDCSNIFNIINPCDPVTVTPVASLGFFRAGKDITILSFGAVLYRALKAADELKEKYGMEAEIIDARTLVPFDYETVIESVKKTGRLVIVTDACERGSFASEVARQITEMAFDYLDAAPTVVASRNWITPAHELEESFFPQPSWILDAIDAKIVPLKGHVRTTNQALNEKLRNERRGV